MEFKKLSEAYLLSRLQPEAELLPPLRIAARLPSEVGDHADARIQLAWGDFKFSAIIEVKTQSTPLMVLKAATQAKTSIIGEELPMIMVPYLSPERLQDLEQMQVSGIDLCGNGIVVVPGYLYVLRTGQPNRFPESRPLSNPYRGRSALVGRMLLLHPKWQTLKELTSAIEKAGGDLSLPQASKAIQAMEDDLIVSKKSGLISLQEPLKLLDKLAASWEKFRPLERKAFRLPSETKWAQALSSDPQLQWAVTGESSVTRYIVFSQCGPRKIAVSNLPKAAKLLEGIPESIPNFADVELLETLEPGIFFGSVTDNAGIHWASRIQTWLELKTGDARQQDAARELQNQILEECKDV